MEKPPVKLTRREQYGLVGFVVILTGVVLAKGGWNQFGSAPLKPVLPSPLALEKPSPAPAKEVVVYVSGAVKKPGVYHFKEGQRFNDAIKSAGGFRADALQEVINLAEPLKDADHLRVPTKSVKTPSGERIEPAPRVATASTKSSRKPSSRSRRQVSTFLPPAPVMVIARPLEGRVIGEEEGGASREDKALTAAANGMRWGGSVKESGGGRAISVESGSVDINTASSEELQGLPSVGPVTADRIVRRRKEKGEFKSPEDLMDVKGIGPRSYAKMKSRVNL